MVPGTVSTVSAHVIPNRRKKEKRKEKREKSRSSLTHHHITQSLLSLFVDISFENKLRR